MKRNMALGFGIAAILGCDHDHEVEYPRCAKAPRTIVLTIVGREEGLAARLDLVQGEHAAASRQLATREADCEELFQSAALAIVIAIDPHALLKPAAPPPPFHPKPPRPRPRARRPRPRRI